MTSVLRARSSFEEVAQEVELERWKIKLPDRSARIVIESPTIASLDPESADFEAFQRRKANEQFKRAEMAKVAHETGVPEELLRALQRQPTQTNVDSTSLDEQQARAFQMGLDEETMHLDIALRQEQNVHRVANQARRSLEAGHRMNPIHEFETQFYDLTDSSDEEDIPIYRPNTHTHTPREPPNLVPRRSKHSLGNDRRSGGGIAPDRSGHGTARSAWCERSGGNRPSSNRIGIGDRPSRGSSDCRLS